MAKVLLVEDDNSLREIFEMRLQADGYTTVTASDGEEGLTAAMKEKPDLIIADVMMPKLSGFEMLENLRAVPEMKNTKVIMMTALGQAEDRARGESLGVVKYLVKSQATLEDFASVVRDVLSPDQAGAATSQKDNSTDASKNNQSERKDIMQEDNTPTNPTNNADGGASSDAPTSMPPTNPVAGDGDMPASDGGQLSTAQEQSNVSDQINNFAGAAPAAPADDAAAGPEPATTFTPTTPPADGGMGDGAASSPAPAAPADDAAAESDQPAAPADSGNGSV